MKLNTEFYTENVQFEVEGVIYTIPVKHFVQIYQVLDQHIDREEE